MVAQSYEANFSALDVSSLGAWKISDKVNIFPPKVKDSAMHDIVRQDPILSYKLLVQPSPPFLSVNPELCIFTPHHLSCVFREIPMANVKLDHVFKRYDS